MIKKYAQRYRQISLPVLRQCDQALLINKKGCPNMAAFPIQLINIIY